MCYSLRSCKTFLKAVRIFLDSQVGMQIINKMGTTKISVCNNIVKNIAFCVKNKIWIIAAHIPCAQNVTVDYDSKKS